MAALEKQNRELSWQVAMLTRGSGSASAAHHHHPQQQQLLGIGGPPGSVAIPMPAAGAEAASWRKQLTTGPGLVGLVLRYRKQLVLAYLVIVHVLLYLQVRQPPSQSAYSGGPAGGCWGGGVARSWL